jgi:stress-induced morphogen
MPSAEDIRKRIEVAIPGAHADVEDYTGGGDHFRATVTASAFDGLSRIQQHRLVYAIFGAEIGGPIHALALKTQTPSQTQTASPTQAATSPVQTI